MKLITRDIDYAIRAICFIAKSNKKVISVSELVRKLKISRPFLRKILQILNKKGILNSYKGKSGGFSLAMIPEKIYLIDLMEIFQGKFRLNECILSKEVCPDIKDCPLKKKIDDIEKHVESELKLLNIASLLKDYKK